MRAEGQGRLTSAPASRTIIVAGAGIGGLTTAIALAEQRFHVIVLEKAPQLDEAGAGIQLSPNASGVLIRLGLEKHLIERVVTPDDISIVAAGSGRPIVRIPLGASAQMRYGAPYWIAHRADLQAALLARAREHPDIDLCLGAPFDHPHVFLDMGDATEIICPYCSTLYRHDPALDPHVARPAECGLRSQ